MCHFSHKRFSFLMHFLPSKEICYQSVDDCSSGEFIHVIGCNPRELLLNKLS